MIKELKDNYFQFLRETNKSENFIKSVDRVFRNIEKYERTSRTSFEQFSIEDFEKFLVSLESYSVDSLDNTLRIILGFMDFNKESFKENFTDEIKKYFMNGRLNKLVSTGKRYFSETEIVEIVDILEDFRDKMLILLMYEGFYDPQFHTITNLKISDIDFQSKTCLGKPVSDMFCEIAQKTMKEKFVNTYTQNSIVADDELIESDYLIREKISTLKRKDVVIGDNFNGYSMNRYAILNRFTRIKKVFLLDKLSSGAVYTSGIINRTANHVTKYCSIEEKGFRKEFIDYCMKEENVKSNMAYRYYKVFMDSLK